MLRGSASANGAVVWVLLQGVVPAFWRPRGGASSIWERSSLRSVTPVWWRGRHVARVQSRSACAAMCVYCLWHNSFLGARRKSIVKMCLRHSSARGTSGKEGKVTSRCALPKLVLRTVKAHRRSKTSFLNVQEQKQEATIPKCTAGSRTKKRLEEAFPNWRLGGLPQASSLRHTMPQRNETSNAHHLDMLKPSRRYGLHRSEL